MIGIITGFIIMLVSIASGNDTNFIVGMLIYIHGDLSKNINDLKGEEDDS